MTRIRTAADATRKAATEKANALTRAITAKRSDRLVGPLKRVLAQAREADSDQDLRFSYGYGFTEMPTTRVFREIDSQGRLHTIDWISGDVIDGVTAYVIDGEGTGVVFPGAYFPGGEESFPGNIRNNGLIEAGRFSGVGTANNPPNGSQIRLYDGTQQNHDPDLIAQTSLDTNFIGRGLSYLWSRMVFQEGRFNGDPSIRVYARARKVIDPRDATVLSTFDELPKNFSVNNYQFVFDYLMRPKNRGGAGIDAAFIDLASFQSSTLWSETVIEVEQASRVAVLTTRTNQNTGIAPINTNHILEFEEAVCPFQFGDVVHINASEGQTLPSNLSSNTDYFVVPIRPTISSFQLSGMALADSLENSLRGVTIPQGDRLSDITVTKVKEIRHQVGFTYQSGDLVLDRMLESCGASLYLRNGKIAITQQSFPESSEIKQVDLDELIGSISFTTSLDADDRATSLSGTFRSVTNLFAPKDYSSVGDSLFVEEDKKESPQEFDLPLVAKGSIAQRQATIELRRRRQEKLLAFSGDLSLLRLRPSTVFTLDFPRYGLNADTTFEVRSQSVFLRIDQDVPSFSVDIEARQLEATTFDLDATNSQFIQEAKITGLDNPFEISSPSSVSVSEELYQTRDGAGIRSRANITWTASESRFVTRYEISFRLSGTSNLFFLAQVPSTDLQTRIEDLQPGFYDFQVIAINSQGQRSEVAEPQVLGFEIKGLLAPPSDPTGFQGQVLGAANVLLRWNRSTDLDVLEGGFVEIRHSPQITGAVAKDSVFFDSDVGGQSSLIVPFSQGTYWLRFQDSTGQFSGPVSWSTQSRRPVDIAFLDGGAGNALDDSNTDPDAFTLQVDPTFPDTEPDNTLVFVTDHLELPLEDTFDDEADVDAITNIDEVGGGNVTPEGFYFFPTDIEIDTPTRILVEAVISTEVFDLSTSIDAEDDFDQIPNVDQIGGTLLTPGLATAEIEVRFSDDPVASDTFGPWEPVNTQFIRARSFQFRIVARSTLPTVNIRVNQARIRMRVVNL